MTNLKKWMAGAGVGIALLTVTAVALPMASANTQVAAPVQQTTAPGSGSTQTPNTTTPATPKATTPDTTTPNARPALGHRGGPGADGDYLAQALGITTDQLAAAQQKASEAAIDQALAAGTITQEQADALKARLSTDGFDRGARGLRGVNMDRDQLLADALGISVAELTAAKTEARQLGMDAAVADGSMTQEQADAMQAREALKQYMEDQDYSGKSQALFEEMVKQAVQAGVITQAQADSILASGHGLMGGRGDMRGRGGRGGFRGDGGMGTAPTQNTAPTDSTDL